MVIDVQFAFSPWTLASVSLAELRWNAGAILDAFAAIGGGDATDIADRLALVVRLVETLSKMCR